jgi:hypothetical protein
MPGFKVGDQVMVHMQGFQRGGVAIGAGAWMAGAIAAINGPIYTVELHVVLVGVNSVDVTVDRLRPA